jgi:hypothetical protein
MKNENHRLSTTTIAERNIIASGQVQVCGGRQEIRKNRNGPKLDTRSGNTKAKLELHVGGSDISAEQICLSKVAFGIRAAKGNGMYTEIFRGRYDN